MKEFKLSPPWITYVNELTALFKGDEEVDIVYDDSIKEVKLYVESSKKAQALMALLPMHKDFGGVELKINVIPANDEECSKEYLFRTAFEGNTSFADVATVTGVFSNPITFVVFKPEVVQFWNDNMGDAFGNWNGLMQDVAEDVFDLDDGVFFSTAELGNNAAAAGEWLKEKEE